MQLIDQHTKSIMEGCKERAREAGLRFEDETLEYIVTNRDLLELSPKMMIPTLYDYWVHDVEVLKEKGKYELYPSNPYETVINTRPAISFYNDNNPDWLNVMIFYHVLAHIDFFQNNQFFRHTWDIDFTGQALSDKRLIARLRSKKGRWVDYVIEFARSMDNLVGYHQELYHGDAYGSLNGSDRLNYYFDVFLQEEKKVSIADYIKEIERYNSCQTDHGDLGEQAFFADVLLRHPEFDALLEKFREADRRTHLDVFQFVLANSTFINREDNRWMKPVVEVIRATSLVFQPQIRTKIMNEGWASYWHETLFLKDDRIQGHEADFARVNAWVTSMPRVGLNPYALGMRLFYYLEEMADKGRRSLDYQGLRDARARKDFDTGAAGGRDFIFHIREHYADGRFVSDFIDQDFVDRHRLFVAGKRMDPQRMVWQYYVKSRSAEAYRAMVAGSLYHPPHLAIDADKMNDGALYLNHAFEGKPLVQDFIGGTLLGIAYLWGAPVHLETSEVVASKTSEQSVFIAGRSGPARAETQSADVTWQRVVYTMKDRKLSRKPL
ncbi:MAG: SpoVR family protein [Pseudomonadota bacterium]